MLMWASCHTTLFTLTDCVCFFSTPLQIPNLKIQLQSYMFLSSYSAAFYSRWSLFFIPLKAAFHVSYFLHAAFRMKPTNAYCTAYVRSCKSFQPVSSRVGTTFEILEFKQCINRIRHIRPNTFCLLNLFFFGMFWIYILYVNYHFFLTVHKKK